MNLKLIFGIASIISALFAYYYYFRDIFRGHTKPHTFSWLIFGILAANGFVAQVHGHGGIGTWATGLTSLASLSIFGLAIFKGDNQPTRMDWVLLAVALVGFTLLFVITNKDLALCITLITVCIGFAMTIKKAYFRPGQETAKSFVLNTIKFIPSIMALSSFSFLTVAYPLVALLGNAAIAAVILWRRSVLL